MFDTTSPAAALWLEYFGATTAQSYKTYRLIIIDGLRFFLIVVGVFASAAYSDSCSDSCVYFAFVLLAGLTSGLL